MVRAISTSTTSKLKKLQDNPTPVTGEPLWSISDKSIVIPQCDQSDHRLYLAMTRSSSYAQKCIINMHLCVTRIYSSVTITSYL